MRGGGFESYYYFDELGKYKKTRKDAPDFFIVEFIIDPRGNNVSVAVDSLAVIRKAGSSVKPEQWHLNEAWIHPSKRGTGLELTPNEVACLHLRSFMEMNSVKSDERVNIRVPTCILLRYPITPIYPGENFAFMAESVFLNGDPITPVRVEFKGEKVRSFTGYMLGP